MAPTKKAAAKPADPKPTATKTAAKDESSDVETIGGDDDAPPVTPTLLRSDGVGSLDEVPDNTPPVNVDVSDADKADDGEAPAGYAYVIHPKSGQRCLVDARSVPELEVDGYKRAAK